jgi:hypothetical protein
MGKNVFVAFSSLRFGYLNSQTRFYRIGEEVEKEVKRAEKKKKKVDALEGDSAPSILLGSEGSSMCMCAQVTET